MPHQWSWQLLRAGSFRLDGGGMFGVVPKTIWSKMVTPDDQNRIPLQTNCLLLDDGSTKVLIETGFGDKWSDKERGFFNLERRTIVDALREVGVEAVQINHVIVSHLHFDHAAGLTTLDRARNAIPALPNARIHVQRIEWDDALANKSTMTRTYLRNHLDPIAPQLNLVESPLNETEIFPGLFVWLAPGHTWGQQAIRFNDDRGAVAFIGDVLPTIHHAGLAFSLGYDMMPYQSMLTKKTLLQRAAAEGWRLALDHEPGPAIVTVQTHPERPGQFELHPA
jgi:glyoxylase-like metal-dependent hydrolase (beta-lactamase superfamily II)